MAPRVSDDDPRVSRIVEHMESAAFTVSVFSALISAVALWRSWRWQPREARFELAAARGASLERRDADVYVVNVGDVPARGVRYSLEGARLTGDQSFPRNAEILPGESGDQMRITTTTERWEGATVIVSWHPHPVHRGKRKSQRLRVDAAIGEAPPAIDVMKTIF